jgi:cytochrome c biogenesis protein CcmG, thiol:disulfide interchange protein DsbE
LLYKNQRWHLRFKRRNDMMRQRLLFILPVLVLLGILSGFAVGLRRDPSVLPSQLINKSLPVFTLPTLATPATQVKSGSLRGPLLLNVFASWCVACRVEHPLLLRLKKEKIVPLIGMAWKDAAADSVAALRRDGNPYDVALSDVSGRTGINMGVSGVPETFVIDKAGRVRYRHAGPITMEVWQKLLAPLLARLENEP